MKRGFVLMNLGSPDSFETADVKKYLDEFLMDERVIDYPFLFRAILVKGIITPFRATKSGEAYKSIWWKEGSPLIELTRQLQAKVQEKISEPIEIAMRYGNLSVKKAFDNLKNKNVEEVIALPLYPHYAMSSYETAAEETEAIYKKLKYSFKLKIIKPFYDESNYINALSKSLKPYLSDDFDHVLFSYHGIPERHITKRDVTKDHCLNSENCCFENSSAHEYCYRHQVFKTTQLVTEYLGLEKNKYSISFQSRLGKKWLQPFTDVQLEEFPKMGVKKLIVVCPAFVSDCLETLEEMGIRGRESFLNAGGEKFTLIPCLNANPDWVNCVVNYFQNPDLYLLQNCPFIPETCSTTF
jgi:protoporphyrin/coproporphyrin ferrochelatase